MVHKIIHRQLFHIARMKSYVNYSVIGPLIGLTDMSKPEQREKISNILTDIDIEEHGWEHPLLSAVVILAERNMPGDGFFKIARKLGRYHGKKDDLKFWLGELRRVHDFDWPELDSASDPQVSPPDTPQAV